MEATMTNQELIAKLHKWQNCEYVHPFTCGVSSLHPNLEPEERDGKVVLVCKEPGCGFVQEKIPAVVFVIKLEEWMEAVKKTGKNTVKF